MKKLITIFLFCSNLVLAQTKIINELGVNKIDDLQKKPSTSLKKQTRKLIWSDEFSKDGLPDTQKWKNEVGGDGWGNHELQYYTEADTATTKIKNGILHIIAKKQKHGKNDFISAKLITKGIQDFKFGKFEIRAKLPRLRGSWPAIWMLASDIDKVDWPECGEIDIMENVGYDPDTLVGSLHSKAYNHVIGTQKTKRILNKDADQSFHVYGIEWSDDKIDFLLDDKVYYSVKNEHKTTKEWPFSKPFYLILNLAVGGDWGGKYGVDLTGFPIEMQVDYVRVYK